MSSTALDTQTKVAQEAATQQVDPSKERLPKAMKGAIENVLHANRPVEYDFSIPGADGKSQDGRVSVRPERKPGDVSMSVSVKDGPNGVTSFSNRTLHVDKDTGEITMKGPHDKEGVKIGQIDTTTLEA